MVRRVVLESPEERSTAARTLRNEVPRSVHGQWRPEANRQPIMELFAQQEATRLPELLPLRHERMGVSPFTFFRGAANVMAHDLAGEPRTGLIVQLCGDAHLSNFGAFASPERTFVFDMNDYDETLPGPFEWDVKRLVASFEVAARDNGFDRKERAKIVEACVKTYCLSMTKFSEMGNLAVWYSQFSVDDIAEQWVGSAPKAAIARFERAVRKAKSKDNLKALRRLTEVVDGEHRFLSDPPLLVPARELFDGSVHAELIDVLGRALESYKATVQRDRRVLLDRYRLVDLARKVVGVGSVGTRCWVALMAGHDEEDPLFLQIKEAEASVLEPYLGKSAYAQHGQRVVQGQRLTQAAGDILLGWDRIVGIDGRQHDYYFRQLWDWKASASVELMEPVTMEIYANICGTTLARAHARSGDAVSIASYLGQGRTFGSAMVGFASAYADQTEKDHATFVEATTPAA